MNKLTVQLAAEIVTANVEGRGLSTEILTGMINSVAQTLDQLLTQAEVQPEMIREPAKTAKPGMPLSWKKSIGRTKVTCLICGFEGKALGIHLKSKHKLSGKEYRKQFNIPARVSLSSKNLQAKRSKAAKDRGAAENLKIAREARRAKAAGPLS